MNYMIKEIHSLPELMLQIFQPLDDSIRRKIDHELCLSLKRLFVIGCGDSHHAALNTEYAFEKLAGLADEPMSSLQFARYAAGFIPQTGPKTNLVMGISVSGAVSHTIEAVQMGAQAGATTIALTANPESNLAKVAQIIIDVPVPNFPIPENVVVPGIRSYFTSQVGLLLIAVRIAEVRGQLTNSEASDIRNEISNLGKLAEQTIQECEPVAKQIVEETHNVREFVFTGSGPNYGTALFSAAKVLEGSGDAAMGQDVEEWAHLQYFAREKATPTFIISAGDRDISRSEEIAIAAKTIGRRLYITAPKSAAKLIIQADGYFPIPAVREMFSPLLTAIPGELFAAYRAESLGETYFRGFTGGRSVKEGGGISRIRTSEIWETWKH